MPTGYTAEVSKSDNYTFEDFVWACARGMMPLIHMRDDTSDAEITLPKESSYYKDALKQAMEELKELEAMTLEQAKKKCNEEHEQMQEHVRDSIKRQSEVRRRYEAMLAKCQAWNPPTKDHENLKNLMIGQLTQSIDIDCNPDYYEDMLSSKKPTAKQWLKDRIQDRKDRIDSCTRNIQEEHKRTQWSVSWIKQLQNSVPMPKKIKK